MAVTGILKSRSDKGQITFFLHLYFRSDYHCTAKGDKFISRTRHKSPNKFLSIFGMPGQLEKFTCLVFIKAPVLEAALKKIRHFPYSLVILSFFFAPAFPKKQRARNK